MKIGTRLRVISSKKDVPIMARFASSFTFTLQLLLKGDLGKVLRAPAQKMPKASKRLRRTREEEADAAV